MRELHLALAPMVLGDIVKYALENVAAVGPSYDFHHDIDFQDPAMSGAMSS
ncbi:MAG TPA: hypothetical protein PK027_02465 [Aquimonas sp.]|nr:hypothetical protein [Aquimonas sp.]